MITLSLHDRQRAFGVWLRTGRLPAILSADGLELKFNPYHDPRNGRFTFALGGSRETGLPETGYATNLKRASRSFPAGNGPGKGMPGTTTSSLRTESISEARLAGASQRPVVGRGSNMRAFEDPMTLEQSFPGLRNSPGGAVIAVADNLFDLTGPANAMTADVLQDQARELSAQIKVIDPGWHHDEIGAVDALGNRIETIQSLTAKVNDLRFQRAAITARVRGDYEPLQVETLRFVQRNADIAYDRGVALLKAGRLTPRLSDQEALGNYVDQQVRLELRERYNQAGIDSAGAGPVRVNRRENNNSGSELTYRRPDARVNDVAFDVTLTRKTLRTPQVQGFFDADFRPSRVIIIRPRQIGADHSYVISRPETKR